MFDKEKYPIREDWEDYYKTLEGIRRTGVVNMYAAASVLRECYPKKMSEELSNEVLRNWMANYGELNKKYGWQ